MRKQLLHLFLYIIFVFAVVLCSQWLVENKTGCHNKCAHGDRACQDRCFKKGFCPQEDR